MRSIKNKNMKKSLLFLKMFNLDYAGKAHIFITTQKTKYLVVATGIHFVEDTFLFSPNYKKVWKTDKLYLAIFIFNQLIQKLTESLDWYSPEFEENIYEEIFIKE